MGTSHGHDMDLCKAGSFPSIDVTGATGGELLMFKTIISIVKATKIITPKKEPESPEKPIAIKSKKISPIITKTKYMLAQRSCFNKPPIGKLQNGIKKRIPKFSARIAAITRKTSTNKIIPTNQCLADILFIVNTLYYKNFSICFSLSHKSNQQFKSSTSVNFLTLFYRVKTYARLGGEC